jgi:hypothetical protein
MVADRINRRAVGVETADGRSLPARVGVLADVGAPQLYDELLAMRCRRASSPA